MGAYQGYNSQGGALGVGRATTNAVVGSIVLILAVNYLVTAFFVD
jgi:phospholipid/cholesterol/gamma-HCH transport system permease protein